MLDRKKSGLGVRKSFFARSSALIGAAAAAAMLPGAALAQDVTDPAQAEEEEEIIVTGTRVPRPDFAYSNPVTSVTDEAIEYSGTTNLTDFLSDVPALTNSFDNNDATIGNGGLGATGLNLLNLRNLGTQRTLVLVDGRRHVASYPGSAAVDVSTIPVELVERVDVSTGGASAIYGADGVSGVVNMILIDDYEGFGLRAQGTFTEEGGAGDEFVSAIWGANSANGRANLTLAADFTREHGLRTSERFFTSQRGYSDHYDNPAELAVPGDDPNLPDLLRTFDPRIGILNAAGGVDTTWDFYPDFEGGGTPWVSGISVDSNGTFESGGSGLPIEDLLGVILPDTERFSFNGMFHHDIGNASRLFAELKYVNSSTSSYYQGTFDQILAIDVDNPLMPNDIRDALINEGLPFAFMSRFNNDLGLRGEEITRETYRAVLGVEGDLSENFDYEVSLVYGATASETANLNNRWNDRFAAAVDVVDIDPGAGVDLRCRVDVEPYVAGGGFGSASDWNYNGRPIVGLRAYPEAGSFTPGPGSGCVPLDLFGEGAPSQAAMDWIGLTTYNSSVVSQTVFQALVSGTLDSWFRLPGGSVGVAAGVEVREETSSARYDARDQTGLTFYNAIPNQDGDFNVGEIFGEVNLPLLSDQAFADYLSVDLAFRLSDYSTVGTTESWKVGLLWAPIEDITFRATLAEAVRAPNIAELFDPGGQNFVQIGDPCDIDALDNGSEFREANCAAILNGFGVDPTTFEDPNDAAVAGISAGNPGLAAETAETFTFGVIFRPRFLTGFTVAVDYYDIELTDAINTLGPQAMATECVDLPSIDNVFCDLIERSPTSGGIIGFTQRPENVAAFTTSGVDFTVAYQFRPVDWGWSDVGEFNLRLVGSHLEDLSFTNLPGAEPDQDAYEQGAPEWQTAFDILWRRGPLSVNYGFSYFSETRRYSETLMAAQPDLVVAGEEWFSERMVHDLQVRYDVNQSLALYVGGNNLTNQEPDFGQTYYPVGAEGRSFYVGLNARLN